MKVIHAEGSSGQISLRVFVGLVVVGLGLELN